MKTLHRVAVEGDVWVMAEGRDEAVAEARRVVMGGKGLSYDVWQFLPRNASLVDSNILGSRPDNAEDADTRTIADHIEAARPRTPPASTWPSIAAIQAAAADKPSG